MMQGDSDAPISAQTVTQDADVAGGIPADDAAAGDAAVMALVTGKRAPAQSAELHSFQEKSISGTQPEISPRSEEEPEMSPTSSIGNAQYFNLYEGDPDAEEAERVNQWLKNLGLGRYFEQLAAEGFDDMSILAQLEDKQVNGLLETCPMPVLHEQQLRRALSQLRGDMKDFVKDLKSREMFEDEVHLPV
jgi:hypothetical protein